MKALPLVLLVALSFAGCAHTGLPVPTGPTIKPRTIKGLCIDPPFPLPDGVIWTLRPCTLFADEEVLAWMWQ